MLLDHASCEKKAASTALSLMFAYPEDRTFVRALSRLARGDFSDVVAATALAQAREDVKDEWAPKLLLALIGPRWVHAVDREGVRRLDKPDDWVRREITEAIQKQAAIRPFFRAHPSADDRLKVTSTSSTGGRSPLSKWTVLIKFRACISASLCTKKKW
mgnify:CR=1 FL=1